MNNNYLQGEIFSVIKCNFKCFSVILLNVGDTLIFTPFTLTFH